MISEDRIRSMTKLAVFEEGEGKRPISLANYTKSDYRGLQVIKFFVLGSISFIILFLAYAYIQVTSESMEVTLDYLESLLVIAVVLYVVFMIVYMTICITISMRRFHRAKLEVKDYKKQIKDLSQLYEWERKLKTEGTLTHMQLWDPEETEDK